MEIASIISTSLGNFSESCEGKSFTYFNEVEDFMEFVFGRWIDKLLEDKVHPIS